MKIIVSCLSLPFAIFAIIAIFTNRKIMPIFVLLFSMEEQRNIHIVNLSHNEKNNFRIHMFSHVDVAAIKTVSVT